jgi:hypothetical protein
MNLFTDTKLISLTSQSAIKNNSTYLSDVVFYTNGLVTPDNTIIKLELSLLHAEIPVSFYTINYSNSFFKFKLDTDPTQNLQVPVGNYNANTLITALKTLINDANFLITISKINGKLTFQYNKNFIIYTDNQYSIGKILGFDLNTSYSSTVTNPHIINALYPLNLLGIKKINISSSEIATSNYLSSLGNTSLLASIPVDQPSYGLIVYENKSNYQHNIKNIDINKIDLFITDEDNNLINFNNIDWALLFGLNITYDLNKELKLFPINNNVKKDISLEKDINLEKDNLNDLNDLNLLTN